MTTPEMKPLLPWQKDGIMYGFGTKGFSDPEGYSWEIRPVGTRKVSEAEIQVVLEKLHDYIKSLTRPTPQPSSEYVKALESVAEFANNLWWSIEGEAAGIENDLEAQRVNLKKALEDLNALKSRPTPAKEPSGELGKAAEEALRAAIDVNSAAESFLGDVGMGDCYLRDQIEKFRIKEAAYRAQVTKEGVDGKK